MASSLIGSYVQFRLLKQLMLDNIYREQSTKRSLQTFCLPHIQHRCYHITPVYFKKTVNAEKEEIKTLIKNHNFEELKKLNMKGILLRRKILPIIEVWRNMTIKELATSAQRNVNNVLDVLSIIKPGIIYKHDNILTDMCVTYDIVKKLGGKPKTISKLNEKPNNEIEDKDIVRRPPDKSVLIKRHPVVTIMGHVDHGKTTLLDSLRNTSVVETEFGGITQHIGAFDVRLKSGDRVTFLDTPGHAAFKSMRYRGAYVTDIIVLVVAADDGVQEQTIQSIEMAKEANVPVIVAINKIDKPDANIKRIKNMLAENGIIVETLGGDVQCINISALKRINLEELTEAIVLQAELMDLKGDPIGLVEGIAIECTNSAGRGKLVTTLIQRGTLRKGCLLVSGLTWAKVRCMFNDCGHPVLEAKPSEAVEVIGWKELPNVGDEILEVENDRVLKKVLKFRESQHAKILAKEHGEADAKKKEEYIKDYKKLLLIKRTMGITRPVAALWSDKNATQANDIPIVNVIIKGDVAGTVETILNIFDTYMDDKLCRLSVVHYGIGSVTDTDLELAETFNAIIYCFNVNVLQTLETEARKKGLSIRHYKVIYKLFDNIKEEINNKLPEVDAEELLGEASVKQQFIITEERKKVFVAGCRCTNGVLKKSATYRLVRNGETMHTGKLVSMRHLKEEVTSVNVNTECGLRFEDPTVSFKPGDTLVCFEVYKTCQTTSWDPGF